MASACKAARAVSLVVTTCALAPLRGQSSLTIELAQSKASPGDLNALRPAVHYIDRMDPDRGLRMQSRYGVSGSPPSRILAIRGPWGREDLDKKGYGRSGLKLVCELQPSAERPAEKPGWAAYFTYLRGGDEYFNAIRYRYLTFWIRGKEGDEKIQIALVDRRCRENGNNGNQQRESGSIEAYAERGKIDQEWQKVRIPLDIFQSDLHELHQVVVVFDNRLYNTIEARTITVFLDDLAFE